MRPLGLVLMLLVCGPSLALQPLEGENPINLVEELEDPDFEATTGLNLQSVRTALSGNELRELEKLTSQANADIKSAQEVKSPAESMPVGDQPVDVMKFESRGLNYRQKSTAHDAEAARVSARLEAESGKSKKLPTVANMKNQIEDSIRSTMNVHTKGLSKVTQSWDSVLSSESNTNKPNSGMGQGQIQAEVATAEKEQLLNREHAVANAEENLAYLQHEAQHKVEMAEREAQAKESDQLEKIESKEEHAERDEAKARADEAGALKLKKNEDSEVAKLRAEVRTLKQRLGKTGAKQKIEKLELQMATKKAVDKVKDAVQQQARTDKEAEQSELNTLKVSAQDMSMKLQGEKTNAKLQRRTNLKLRKQLEGDEEFTATEVKHAVAKAHLVAQSLWQGKVNSLSKDLVDSQELSKQKVEAANEATEAWVKVAQKLKSKLQQQASAENLLMQAQNGISGQQKQTLAMSQQLKRQKMATEVAKASLELKDKELADASAQKEAARQEVQRLKKQQAIMSKKQTELLLRTQALKERVNEQADRLEKTEAKLKLATQHEPAKGPASFASTKDFVDIVAGVEGAGSDHLLPQVLNTNLDAKPRKP